MSSPKYSADVEGADTSLTGNGSKRGGWASKLLVGAVVANGLLTVILMGLVIWMGTDMKNKTDAHEDLLSGGAILSSSSKVTIPGHRLAGSLFTGSGYWTSLKPMGASRSDHAVGPPRHCAARHALCCRSLRHAPGPAAEPPGRAARRPWPITT